MINVSDLKIVFGGKPGLKDFLNFKRRFWEKEQKRSKNVEDSLKSENAKSNSNDTDDLKGSENSNTPESEKL